MIGRLTSLRGQVSSHWLAGTFAVTYLVVSLVLGIALLNTPDPPQRRTTAAVSTPSYQLDPPQSSPAPEPSARSDDSAGTLTTTEATVTMPPAGPPATGTPRPAAAPNGYQRVTGPAGLRTVIPAGWHSMRTSGPGAVQATDPVDTSRYVKYGGAAAPETAIDDSHVWYENGFAARTEDYRRITLASARYGGHDAVEWEFEHREERGVRHVRSLYWRSDGKEYFLLAAAPAGQWDGMVPIYDTMVANAEP